MVGYLQPLAHNFAIVNELGYPTEYFIRWAQQKQIDIGESVDEGRALEIVKTFLTEHPLQAGSGIDLTPDGDLNNSPTISAKAQEILEQIATTQGSVLFRGAAGWEALPPGTTTQYLKSGGPSADPLWETPSGGGGGGGSWASPVAGASYSTSSFATKGALYTPLVDFTVDYLWPQLTTASGQLYRATIFEVTGTTLGVKVLNETLIPWSTIGAQNLVVSCAPTLLQKGKTYAILITVYNLTATAALSLNVNVGGFSAPLDQKGFITFASTAPSTGGSITVTPGLYGPVGFRFS